MLSITAVVLEARSPRSWICAQIHPIPADWRNYPSSVCRLQSDGPSPFRSGTRTYASSKVTALSTEALPTHLLYERKFIRHVVSTLLLTVGNWQRTYSPGLYRTCAVLHYETTLPGMFRTQYRHVCPQKKTCSDCSSLGPHIYSYYLRTECTPNDSETKRSTQ
jgi:hypothetical protein